MTGSTRSATRGFTLIELLVVMLIIATLLSIAVPRYFRTLEHARETVLRQDLTLLREAIDKYYADLGQYPDTLAALAEKRYLRSIPVDPITKAADTWALVQSDDADHPGIKDVHSGAAEKAIDGSPFANW
jgi:general secretion pathway protein G